MVRIKEHEGRILVRALSGMCSIYYTSSHALTCVCAHTMARWQTIIQKTDSSKRDVALHLQVSKLSWIEKKMAATLFGKIPSSTVPEALQNFLKVGSISATLASAWVPAV